MTLSEGRHSRSEELAAKEGWVAGPDPRETAARQIG
jgi:hypothetical protein